MKQVPTQRIHRVTPLSLIALAVLVTVSTLFPHDVAAQEFECSVPGDKRYIRLELPGQEHLCEVSVTHLDKSRRVMWYANNETLFCSAKIYELRGKYENQWGFTCSEWLDTNGIDTLSERHRTLLDAELKIRIREGLNATTPYRITGVKAVASTPLNLAEGNLAVQYFIQDEGSSVPRDVTHIIFDDGSDWQSIAELDSLSNYIESPAENSAITSALVYDITDAGVLSVNTTVSKEGSDTTNADCQGNQMLFISDNEVAPKSPHRILCNN